MTTTQNRTTTRESKLKSNGFRWTPTLGCWQAYCNWRTQQIASEVAGIGEAVSA